MMRIADKFKELKQKKRKAFVAYVPFGFPRLSDTPKIILALQESGADIIELGLPFSDPLADGPVIQAASNQALANGADTDKLFAMLKKMKGQIKVPVAVMTYYNPVFHYGTERFFKQMRAAGASAIITVDLPFEENKEYSRLAGKYDLDTIQFITLTTSDSRARRIARAARGFIYYISVTGITGFRSLSYGALKNQMKKIKRFTSVPVCIGFGVHTREQVEKLQEFSDGVIVGTALVRFIQANQRKKDFLGALKKYVRSLCMK